VPNRKINNFKDSKRTGAVQGIPAAGLSGCRHVESQPSPQEQAVQKLIRHGVHQAVAAAIVFDQHHPPESVDQAIDNAVIRQAEYRQKGLDRLKPFNRAAYIVGSLNQARREAHVVKPSVLLAKAKALHEQRKAFKPMSDNDFEERRRRCIEGLRRTAS
jgi:hypothetical protein